MCICSNKIKNNEKKNKCSGSAAPGTNWDLSASVVLGLVFSEGVLIRGVQSVLVSFLNTKNCLFNCSDRSYNNKPSIFHALWLTIPGKPGKAPVASNYSSHTLSGSDPPLSALTRNTSLRSPSAFLKAL